MSRAIAATLALVMVFAAMAASAGAVRLDDPKRLWATVNVCDTAAHPDTVGIRASMPGTGSTSQRMYIRFTVEYRATKDGDWTPLPGKGADSGFIAVGSARYVVRSAGRSFRFLPPTAGSTETLRGLVRFEWRLGSKVVHRAVRATAAGHPRAEGSDPKGYSAAFCEVR